MRSQRLKTSNAREQRLFLVTGGAGFIGSHLCEGLLAEGHRVRVLDDLSTGRRENLPDGARLVVGDVCDRSLTRRLMEGTDGCFHLAAVASVARCNEDWVGAHRTNLTGAVGVLDVARELGGLPVVYASSAAVYGDAEAFPLTEAGPVRPLSAYGADKLGCELHARVAALVHGVPTVGLRFFNVYGPRQDPTSPYSGVISVFIRRLAEGRPVDIFGDGHQVRDFVYVGDVVRHLLRAMSLCSKEPHVLNVCTGQSTSILALAQVLAKLTGRPLDVRFHDRRPGDISLSLGSPAQATTILGLRGRTPLHRGLRMTLRTLGAQARRQQHRRVS